MKNKSHRRTRMSEQKNEEEKKQREREEWEGKEK